MSSEEGYLSNGFTAEIEKETEILYQVQVNAIKLNNLIEDVFKISVNLDLSVHLIYMADFAELSPLWTLDILAKAIIVRLMMQEPSKYLRPCNVNDNINDTIENRTMIYLYQCYARNTKLKTSNDAFILDAYENMKKIILINVRSSVNHPEQCISEQIVEIFSKEFHAVGEFLSDLVGEIDVNLQGHLNLKELFNNVFLSIEQRVRKATLLSLEAWILPSLIYFVSDKKNSKLAEFLLDNITPPSNKKSCLFSTTIIGQILRISILPRNGDNDRDEYFYDFYCKKSLCMKPTLYAALNNQLNLLNKLFSSYFLMEKSICIKVLVCIGDCLRVNAQRLLPCYTTMEANRFTVGKPFVAPDSFMIGLARLLLSICEENVNKKIMLIDPTYCAHETKSNEQGVCMTDMHKEMCLLSIKKDEIRRTGSSFSNATELFYMTHKAIDLSFNVCIEKIYKTKGKFNRLVKKYQKALFEGIPNSFILELSMSVMRRFICLRDTLLEPSNEYRLLKFYEATSNWLVQIAAHGCVATTKGFAPVVNPIEMPLLNEAPEFLKSIPEFLLDNIATYLTFINNLDISPLSTDTDAQYAIFTFILIFMGDSSRVSNIHLRARLATALESLLPEREPDSNEFPTSWKSALFTQHPHRLEIVRNLLNVYIDIECFAQSENIEKKFYYRQPIYTIICYLWTIDEQKNCFKALASECSSSANQSTFFRFVSLLINDTTFFMYKCLSNLKQMERNPTENYYNILVTEIQSCSNFSTESIEILKLLTSEKCDIFSNESMAEIVAAMLNYYLFNLIRWQQEDLMSKKRMGLLSIAEATIQDMCQIYINLRKNTPFCIAVSQQCQYSFELFENTEQALISMDSGELAREFADFALNIHRLNLEIEKQLEALANAPDKYLDPVTSALMTDPVILPSSKYTVDRETIATHLQSRRTDMFDCSPLTINQVIPNTNLKVEIMAWVKENIAPHDLIIWADNQ